MPNVLDRRQDLWETRHGPKPTRQAHRSTNASRREVEDTEWTVWKLQSTSEGYEALWTEKVSLKRQSGQR